MAFVSTFYFSRIIGSKVYSHSGAVIGKLKDLIVETGHIRPKVVAVCLKTLNGTVDVDFAKIVMTKQNGQYSITCSEIVEFSTENRDVYYLAKNIMDKQIIDMDGRKLVRVNDLRLAVLASGTFLVAADIGFEGLLRRLGVAKQVKVVTKLLGTNIPSHLILWDEVETVDYGNAGIKLSKDYSNLEKLHPSDLADIIEELDRYAQVAVLSSIDEEKAADVLEELQPGFQRSVLENMPLDKAADLIEKMPADEAADLLEELGEVRAAELLQEIRKEEADEIRDLMEYPEKSVGSLMSTEFYSFNEEATVEQVIEDLKKEEPETDSVYYLYVVNAYDKLVATVTLFDIIVAAKGTKIKEIMNTNIQTVLDDDKIDSLNEMISKYSPLAIPVVNSDRGMEGVVIINDVMHYMLKNRRVRK